MGSGKYTNKSIFGGTVTKLTDVDNDVLDMLFIPAGEEVTVYGGQALIDVVNDTASSFIEFVEITNADAIWASAAVTAGPGTAVEMTPDATQTGGTTYPFDIPSSTSDRIFGIMLDGLVGTTGLFCATMHHSNIKKS